MCLYIGKWLCIIADIIHWMWNISCVSLPIHNFAGLCCYTVSAYLVVSSLVTLLHRKKDKINHSFIHLNLCIALALGLAVFLGGIETATEYQVSTPLTSIVVLMYMCRVFCELLIRTLLLQKKNNYKIILLLSLWAHPSIKQQKTF